VSIVPALNPVPHAEPSPASGGSMMVLAIGIERPLYKLGGIG
jgi:hypothetical protein